MRVTVTDVHTRKAFDIVSILKSNGYEVELQSKRGFLERVFLSLVYFKPVVETISKEDIVLPTEDDTILKIIDKNYKMLLPPKKSVEIALDKVKFSDFCEKEGFSVPKRYSKGELEKLSELPCPIILKLKSGSGAIGIEFVDSLEKFKSLDIDEQNYIIQERLENAKDVEGGFFLFDRGELVSFYSHKRIKTYPKKAGVTIHSVSTNNKTIKDIGEKLLKKLEWSGFAMVEFLWDERANEYKIIELNPRVWGSIMLSEFCGANMLSNYVKLCQNIQPKLQEVKKNKSIRWLIPWDLGYFIKNFYKLDKNSCYINFSYANPFSSMMFLIYNLSNPKIIKKLFKKILS